MKPSENHRFADDFRWNRSWLSSLVSLWRRGGSELRYIADISMIIRSVTSFWSRNFTAAGNLHISLSCHQKNLLWRKNRIPAGNYMFKVNNRNTRTKSEICSKLTIKIPKRHHWRRSVSLLLTLNIFHSLFYCFYC